MILQDRVTKFVLDEADCLDDRRWEDWLACYAQDAVFWVPSWHDDETLIDDPYNEISLIFCEGRVRLEERVWRIESGLSSSLIRMPRARHFISNIRVRDEDGSGLQVTANFLVNTYKLQEQVTEPFFGKYTFTLEDEGTTFKIKRKYIIVCNDIIHGQMDFFNI
jgi:benzoate/toluate 1,2-dioxygenase beta subunit